MNKPIIYTVEASNAVGKAITEKKVTQAVEQPKPVISHVLKAPYVAHIKPQTITANSKLTISSKYTGTPEPEVKWLKNGKEIVTDESVTISNEGNTTTLTVCNVDRKRTGKYEIVATNEVGESRALESVMVSNDATSDELIPPYFTQLLKPKTVHSDEVVILEAIVESNPFSSFQWFFNAIQITQTLFKRIHSQDNRSIIYYSLK